MPKTVIIIDTPSKSDIEAGFESFKIDVSVEHTDYYPCECEENHRETDGFKRYSLSSDNSLITISAFLQAYRDMQNTLEKAGKTP